MSKSDKQQFEDLSQAPQPGLVAEFIDFLKHNKKWWLLPIIVVMAAIAGLLLLTSTAAAPFIYPLF